MHRIKQDMLELQHKLDELSARVTHANLDARSDARKELEGVRERLTLINQKIDNVDAGTESTWEDIKAGVTQSYRELNESFEKTRHWVSEKIEPKH